MRRKNIRNGRTHHRDPITRERIPASGCNGVVGLLDIIKCPRRYKVDRLACCAETDERLQSSRERQPQRNDRVAQELVCAVEGSSRQVYVAGEEGYEERVCQNRKVGVVRDSLPSSSSQERTSGVLAGTSTLSHHTREGISLAAAASVER